MSALRSSLPLRHFLFSLTAVLALSLGACNKKQTAEEKADAQKVADEAKIQKYLAAQGLIGAVRTTSGAYYAVKTPGTGVKPTSKQLLKVNYRLYLPQGDTTDGALVESTYFSGVPAYFRPSGVIPGFAECLLLMSKGEVGRMVIPSGAAYGTTTKYTYDSSGNVTGVLIPASTNLIYYIELLDIQN